MMVDDKEDVEIGEKYLCTFGDDIRSCKCLINDIELGALGEPILLFLRWFNEPGESLSSYKELMVGANNIVGLWKYYDTWR